MTHLLFLDVAPDPVGMGISAGLVMLAIVVLMCAAAFVVAFVFLLRTLLRKKRPTKSSPQLAATLSEFQPSSPNQP